MMKRNHALCMTLSVLALTSVLASCSKPEYTYPDADYKEGEIVTVNGHTYKYDEIYAMMNGKKESAQAYYTTAKNILAQLVTPITDTMRNTVESEMNDLHDTWSRSAKTNSTSYKEEQEKGLKSEDVETEDELRAKKLANLQNTQNSSDFFKSKEGEDKDKATYFISEEETKKFVEDNAPYHISHILIKVDAGSDSDDNWRGEISSDDARQIGDVVNMLSTGNAFGDVAEIASDDGSKSQSGELSTTSGSDNNSSDMIAMLKSTGYVNEFKLGLYAYDAYLNPNVADKDKVKESLQIPEGKETSAVKDEIQNVYQNNIAYGIPLTSAYRIAYYKDTVKELDGTDILNKKAASYPRSILFNNYFNNHAVNFIYDDSDQYGANYVEDAKAYAKAKGNIGGYETWTKPADTNVAGMEEKYAEYTSISKSLALITKDRFSTLDDQLKLKTVDNNGEEEEISSPKILKDENNHPIIVTRAGTSGDSGYQGIHFIIVNNDPFTADANGDASNKYKYYRTNLPKENSTEFADSTSYTENPSFINFVRADQDGDTTYRNRATAIQNVIRSSDSHSEYLLWDANVAAYNAKHPDKSFETVIGVDIFNSIQEMIRLARKSTDRTAEESLDSSWETYIQNLEVHNAYAKRTLPGVCASFFEAGDTEGEGGRCHVQD